jgi:hypothetical protein
LAFFGELMARSGGTMKITLHDVIGGDEHTVGLHQEFAESGGVGASRRPGRQCLAVGIARAQGRPRLTVLAIQERKNAARRAWIASNVSGRK